MIKIIGISLTLIGLCLFILTMVTGKRKDIRGASAELKMILGSGYVFQHTSDTKKSAELFRNRPIKVPPRKRVLSKEALELLEKVESERKAESNRGKIKQRPAYTEVLSSKDHIIKTPEKEKGTAVLMPLQNKTGILPGNSRSKHTDILHEKGKREASTGILKEATAKIKGTDVLTIHSNTETDIFKNQNTAGTDILTMGNIPATDILKTGKGTDILKPKNKSPGTDIIKANQTPIGTEVIKNKNEGTAILSGEAHSTGILSEEAVSKTNILKSYSTDILSNKKGNLSKIDTNIFNEDIFDEEENLTEKFKFKEAEYWKTAKELGYKGGTDILEESTTKQEERHTK